MDSLRDAQRPLEEAIQRLSDQFTRERPQRYRDYGSDAALRCAYGLFFFPQTFARSRFVVSELCDAHGWRPPDETCRILDLGAGSGAAGLAVAHRLIECQAAGTVELEAVDHSPEALSRLVRIADRIPSAAIQVKTRRGDLRRLPSRSRSGRPPLPADLVVVSFALNEIVPGGDPTEAIAWINGQSLLLKPGGRLILLEPALRQTSERLEAVRDALLAGGDWYAHAPCPHQSACPLLAGGRYWCHEVRPWEPPASLEFLNRHLYRSIRDLKWSFLVLAREPAPRPPEGLNRLVSPIRRSKGLYRFAGCTAEGIRQEWEFQRRDLTRDQQARLESLQRGDLVVIDSNANRGDDVRGVARLEDMDCITGHHTPGRP